MELGPDLEAFVISETVSQRLAIVHAAETIQRAARRFLARKVPR